MRQLRPFAPTLLITLSVLVAACSFGSNQTAAGPSVPDGFRIETYARGLRSPTAMAFGPDGKLYVTQLSGGENAGSGEVVVLDQLGAEPRVILDQLQKPTGLAWRDNELWITAGRAVLRVRADPNGQFGAPETIVRDLPFNGRSEGQIDVLPDGRLLFEASGSVGADGSGQLITLESDDTPQVFATGLKNAYAHTIDQTTGRVFTTEIGDDPMNGSAPPEELNLIVPGADYGWPRCYDQATPATDRGGTNEVCSPTQRPLATFPPHTTPTALTFYDRDDFPPAFRNALYVGLWNGSPPHILRVTLAGQGAQLRGDVSLFAQGLGRPIDLLPDQAGGLLVLDFEGGVIYRVISSATP